MANSNFNSTLFCQSIADKCWQKYFNLSHEAMENCYLVSPCFEPQSIKSSLLYPLTTVYSLILILGITGNLITCFVIATSNYCLLQTTTNRYLMNLAIADLVGLVSGIPFEIYLIWNQYPWHPPDFVCHLKAWVSETTSYVSVLTIVTFSIERYVAICHSFAMAKLSASINRHLTPILLILWCIAGICAAPYGIFHRADYILRRWPGDTGGVDYGPIKKTRMCMLAIAFDPGLRPVFQILFHGSAVLFFFLPLTLLIGLYGKVGWVVKRSRRKLNSYRQQSTLISDGDRKSSTNTSVSVASTGSTAASVGRHDYDSKKVLTILVAVVVTFFICYAPYQAQRLLFFYIHDSHTHQTINTYLFTISGTLFYLSSVLNPILYNVISARYRRAFREVLCRGTFGRRVFEQRYYEKWHRRLHKQAQSGVCGICAGGFRRGESWSSSQISVVKAMMFLNPRENTVTILGDESRSRIDRSKRKPFETGSPRIITSMVRGLRMPDSGCPKIVAVPTSQRVCEKANRQWPVVSAVVMDEGRARRDRAFFALHSEKSVHRNQGGHKISADSSSCQKESDL